jgi:ACR3 family arsenite efflux pump ArsB
MTLTPAMLILLLKIQRRKYYNYAKGMVIVTEAPCQSDFCNFALILRKR